MCAGGRKCTYPPSKTGPTSSSTPPCPTVFANYADVLGKAVDQVPGDNPRYKEFHDLVDSFRYFAHLDPALVSGESLIREFIGGGSYHYS